MQTRTLALTALIALALPTSALAQDMSASDRDAAVARVRSIASCIQHEDAELQRILRLMQDSETQRDRARDAAVRRDAERALEALVARAADVQQRARACLAGDLPSPGTEVVVREPPPDDAADSVAESGGTVRTVEENAELTGNVRVVRAEQVDGAGRMDGSAVRAAVRAIGSQLQRCYEGYLDRGSVAPRELDLVFAFQSGGRASDIDIERSGFADSRFEQCVRQAARALRASRGPQGGAAMFSYRLRFGR